jgi:hypothetical protein
MRLALTDPFHARWTDRIHEEWTRNVLSNRPDITAESLARCRQLMDEHVTDCLVTGYETLAPILERFFLGWTTAGGFRLRRGGQRKRGQREEDKGKRKQDRENKGKRSDLTAVSFALSSVLCPLPSVPCVCLSTCLMRNP